MEHIFFNGKRYSKWGKYYRQDHWHRKREGEMYLHRAIWVAHHGPIPDGYEIHHKQGPDNVIENLECLTHEEHCARHFEEASARSKRNPPSKLAQQKAAAWHGSSKGRKWHKKHAIRTWVKREWVKVACRNCGKEFETPYPTRAKWCDGNCKASAWRRSHPLLP